MHDDNSVGERKKKKYSLFSFTQLFNKMYEASLKSLPF